MLKSVGNGDLTDEVNKHRQELLSLTNLLDIYTISTKMCINFLFLWISTIETIIIAIAKGHVQHRNCR